MGARSGIDGMLVRANTDEKAILTIARLCDCSQEGWWGYGSLSIENRRRDQVINSSNVSGMEPGAILYLRAQYILNFREDLLPCRRKRMPKKIIESLSFSRIPIYRHRVGEDAL